MGLDASSTTIGLSIVSFDGYGIKLEHKEFFHPPKKGNIFERLSVVRQYIMQQIDTLKPDEIALEDIILFMFGKSSAQTTTILAALNRTVGVAIYDKTGKPPFLYSVNFIRKNIKLGDKSPAKEEIPDVVANILGIKFPYILNKKKNIAVENFDMADSIAAALCYILIEQKGLSHEQGVKRKKTRKKKK